MPQPIALPLTGAPVVLTFPGDAGQPQITLQGEIHDAYDGSVYTAHDADEGGSLFQISPGQWTLLQADPAHHTYTFAPVGEVQDLQQATVQFNVDALFEQQLISPSEIRRNLSGEIGIETEVVSPGPFISPGAAIGFAVGMGLAALAITQLRRRQQEGAALKSLWARCEKAARDLKAVLKAQDALPAELTATLDALMDRGRALKANLERLQTRLRPYRGRAPEGPLAAEVERLRSERDRGTAELHQVASTLEALSLELARRQETASPTEEVRERLERLGHQTQAAIRTQEELNTLRS